MANKKATAVASLAVFGVVLVIATLILVPALTAVTADQMFLWVGMAVGIGGWGAVLVFALTMLFKQIYSYIDRRAYRR